MNSLDNTGSERLFKGCGKPFAVVFFVCLVIRLLAAVFLMPTTEEVMVPLADSTDYDHLARTILSSFSFSAPNGEPTAFRPPGYPAFLAAVYFVFGLGNLKAVVYIQAFFGALASLLAAVLGRQIGLGLRCSILCGVLYGFYPSFVVQTALILSEVFGRFLLLLFFCFFLEGIQKKNTLLITLGGILYGFTILNKPVFVACAPFLGLIVLFVYRPNWKRCFLFAFAFTLPVVLMVGSWTLRNYKVSGHFIPVSTNFPITFAQSVSRHSFYTKVWYEGKCELLKTPDNYLQLTQLRNYSGVEDELEKGAYWSSQARGFIGEHPGFYSMLLVRRSIHYWGPFIRNSRTKQLIALLTMGPVLLGGGGCLLLWLFSGREKRKVALSVLAIVLPAFFPYMLSQPDVRYRLSIADPFFIILMVAVFSEGVVWYKEKYPSLGKGEG